MWLKPLFVGATIAALSVSPSAGVAQSSVSLTVNQTRELALTLLNDGDAQRAGSLAESLLERDPSDVTALIVASRAASALGFSSESGAFARRAYWASSRGDVSFVAARLAANAYAAERKDSRAQLWLRRAAQYAPDAAADEAIARDFQGLRRRNPWNNSLRFGITPQSNINGGTDEVIVLGGFPLSSPPLSGLRYSGTASTTYRADVGERSATFIDAFASFNLFSLSNEAQEIAPDVSGSDFASGTLGYGLRHRRILVEGARPTDFGLRVAQNWVEGEVDNRTVDMSIAQSWTVFEDALVSGRLARQYQVFNDDDPADSWSTSLTWAQAIGADRLRLSLGATHSISKQSTEDFTLQSISGSYDFGRTVQGFFFGIDLSYQNQDFDQPTAIGGIDRVDVTRSATLRVGNENIEYYGFQPLLSVTQTEVDSTFDFFDRDSFSVGFDLRSSF